MELREMRAFVAVVEEGGLSAAARRLLVSQSAVSQTVNALEREVGAQLLVRSSTGVRPTEAGATLAAESRAVLVRYDQALAAVARAAAPGDSVLRVGVPLELPPDLLPEPMAGLAVAHPRTRVVVRHLSSADQLAALRTGELEVGLLRSRPAGPEFDATVVVRERLGVLLSAETTAGLRETAGVRLERLAGLDWLGFPRSDGPAWFDEIVAVLRSYGIDAGPSAAAGQSLIAEVKLAAVSSGGAFAFAPEGWTQPLPEAIVWSPLIGTPLVRRTWAVWPADSRRRDLGYLISHLSSSGS
jgi:DNA-binding transcriptional LysR family regulator